jgi:probable rRNA maturation factor
MEINVLVDEPFKGDLEEGWLEAVARQVLEAEKISAQAELGLFITTGERIKQLNRDYLGEDEPTDVLAFSAREGVGAELPTFVPPPDGVLHLGEIIIAYPQALIQAGEHQHSIKKEIAILIIHGVLHLLGYDHDKLEQERQMRAREAELLGVIEGGLD